MVEPLLTGTVGWTEEGGVLIEWAAARVVTVEEMDEGELVGWMTELLVDGGVEPVVTGTGGVYDCITASNFSSN